MRDSTVSRARGLDEEGKAELTRVSPVKGPGFKRMLWDLLRRGI